MEMKTKKKKNERIQKLVNQIEANPVANLLASIYLDLIDDATLEVCYEMHKKAKSGLLCVSCDSLNTEIVNRPGSDIFGQTQTDMENNSESFECVNCKRAVMASRYAPHLEKCMGYGRNSSRIASSRLAYAADKTKVDDLDIYLSESDEDNDYSPIETPKPVKKEKQPKISKKETEAVESFKKKSDEELKSLLATTCGVISSSTGRMCSKTINCPQHTDAQREQVRLDLLGKHVDLDKLRSSIKEEKRKQKNQRRAAERAEASAAAHAESAPKSLPQLGPHVIPSGLDPIETFVDIDTVDEAIDHFINGLVEEKRMMAPYDSSFDSPLLHNKHSSDLPAALTLMEDDFVDVL